MAVSAGDRASIIKSYDRGVIVEDIALEFGQPCAIVNDILARHGRLGKRKGGRAPHPMPQSQAERGMSEADKSLVQSYLAKHSIMQCPTMVAVGMSRLEAQHGVPPAQGMRENIKRDAARGKAEKNARKLS